MIMPVEIKELIIKAKVTGSSQPNDSSNHDSKDTDSSPNVALNYRQKKEIVDECVLQIMDLLEKKYNH
jgi:hypothetical protein